MHPTGRDARVCVLVRHVRVERRPDLLRFRREAEGGEVVNEKRSAGRACDPYRGFVLRDDNKEKIGLYEY